MCIQNLWGLDVHIKLKQSKSLKLIAVKHAFSGTEEEWLESLKAEMADNLKKLTDDFDKLAEMYGDREYYLPIVNRFKTTKDFSQTAVFVTALFQPLFKRGVEVVVLRCSVLFDKVGILRD